MDATLRFATTEEDRAAVYRLRYELYVEDQGLFGDEADHERRWLTDEHDASSRILLAEIDGRVVGTARLTWGSDAPFADDLRETYDMERFRGVVDERDIVVGTRLLVREVHRGGMLAFQLTWKTYEFSALHNVDLILGNCEPHLVNRYHKLGFRPYGPLYNHVTNGVLVPLAVVAGDFEYLQEINSPMLIPLRLRTRSADNLDCLRPLIVADAALVSETAQETEDYLSAVSRWLTEANDELAGVFSDLTHDEALTLLAKSHILACNRGDMLIGKGHTSRTLYILLSGSLEVIDDGRIVAVVEERGSIVGEVAFFTGGERMSHVVAGREGARVLALSDKVLREIIASHGPTAAKFLHFVSRGLCDKLLERAGASPVPDEAVH